MSHFFIFEDFPSCLLLKESKKEPEEMGNQRSIRDHQTKLLPVVNFTDQKNDNVVGHILFVDLRHQRTCQRVEELLQNGMLTKEHFQRIRKRSYHHQLE